MRSYCIEKEGRIGEEGCGEGREANADPLVGKKT